MGRAENVELARYHVEQVWNSRRTEVIDEIYSEDFVLRSLWPNPNLPGGEGDRAGAKAALERWLAPFPDMHFSFDQIVADGDVVVTVHTCTATDDGGFMGRPPTGRGFSVNGILIHRMADGKISRIWTMFDMLGVLQQLGIAPSPPAAT